MNHKPIYNVILFSISFIIISFFISCQQHYNVNKVEGHCIEMTDDLDSHLYIPAKQILDKYAPEIHVLTDSVIGYSDKIMTKKGKESVLGNFASDVIIDIAHEIFDTLQIDMGLINSGGIRTDFPKGEVKIKHIYEIFPFNNKICVITLKGTTIRQLFNSFAKRNKFECFSGAKIVVKNNKVINITINGKPLNDEAYYNVATIDFVANGKDNMHILLDAVMQYNSDVILKDGFINYIKNLTSNGKHINAKIDGRIIFK